MTHVVLKTFADRLKTWIFKRWTRCRRVEGPYGYVNLGRLLAVRGRLLDASVNNPLLIPRVMTPPMVKIPRMSDRSQ